MSIFSKKHQSRSHNSKFSIILDDNKIEEKPEVKFLGVILDQFPNIQGENKNILRKIACWIKILQSIEKPLTIKNRILLLVVITHLHYLAILLSSLTSNLLKLLQKQLSRAIKTCCDRRKFDSSSDLKLQYRVHPVSLYLDWKIVCHLWKIKPTPLPVYVKIKYVNKTIDENKRTKKTTFQSRFSSHYIEKKFFQKISSYLKPYSKSNFKHKQQQFNWQDSQIYLKGLFSI